MIKKINILGIRGLPAAHGGFETFAHHFALYLVGIGWDVTVYCQHNSLDPDAPLDYSEDSWCGIKRVHLAVPGEGPFSTIKFDWKAAVHASAGEGVDLILGYNTAIFGVLHRLRGKKVAINMDGVEWRRNKWSLIPKVWFYLNELVGCHVAQKVIADHPEIRNHLRRHGCFSAIVIPYGAPDITSPHQIALENFNLQSKKYFISIARIEPENSILEIVRAYSSHDRSEKLVVLGKIDISIPYHREVVSAASDGVIFAGAIYDQSIVQSLRVSALAYVHGHQVGGTNPSLVEAMGCGCAVIAHYNKFNRWVAGSEQLYFKDCVELSNLFDRLSLDTAIASTMSIRSRDRHNELFTYERVHKAYEDCLVSLLRADKLNIRFSFFRNLFSSR